MKKAFDQTVRDLKREVNKKVLKVPTIEQKVLDATSNEPWGPHGSHLADIAQATRNYHEYQMIMSVIWKRINDTGKNWRHVYKALTILEYLVAHGSERVIDEIREHAYQISTLSDFQYIDSSGRDQGSNVRKKSQSLVVLVNDKERIQEVRQKAAANRDKYRNTSGGSMYRPGSYSGSGGYGDRYDDDRYGSRDDDRNGYGRERDYRDDERYAKYGDSYGRDADRYSRDYEDRYSRDGSRDDDYRGRSRSVDNDYQYGSRSRSADRDRERNYEDDGQYSSRGSGAKADDHSQDGSVTGKRLDRKYSEQNLGAPPTYEEAVGASRSPAHSERDGETAPVSAPRSSSPPASYGLSQATSMPATPADASPPPPPPVLDNKEVDNFDEFDPRGSFSAVPTTSNGSGGGEMDLLGSLSESFSNSLALVPATPATTTSEADLSLNPSSGQAFAAPSSASAMSSQAFDDPFGDGPFRAIPSTEGVAGQPPTSNYMSFHPTSDYNPEPPQAVPQETANNSGNSFASTAYLPSGGSTGQNPSSSSQYTHQELPASSQDIDILADILPLSGPSSAAVSNNQPAPVAGFQMTQHAAQTGFPSQAGPVVAQTGFQFEVGQNVPQTGFPGQSSLPSVPASFQGQSSQSPSFSGYPSQGSQAPQAGFPTQNGQPGSLSGFPSQTAFHAQGGQFVQPGANLYGAYHSEQHPVNPGPPNMAHVSTGASVQNNSTGFLAQPSSVPLTSQMTQQAPQMRGTAGMTSQPSLPDSTSSLAIVPQPTKDKFETKSTVWADTLSRGLVNLNISGSKINPLSDIGIDFDALNRKEKRMEKPTTAPVTSTINMGKAMGSGSGIGRAGAGALRPPPNPMMGGAPGMGVGMGGAPGMGVGMGGAPGMGVGMGGYGVNQPMGMGMGMNMPGNMGPGANIGLGQGGQMQQPMGYPSGAPMAGGYNPMMGTGYGQQPYGGGYR